ncbi:Alpha/Beta hydrolase protein [Lasiosphaeria miniovina]|uniref:Alpha/Beta hydrolase protein n=1 Tax=Lasiosphaeria miniovina TaxID=1954250 RepID=A0AA39ZZ62_9PEZI|nr:Alpha/Beta hydrolase protein [Lasiosphaeria miniovina]KAK0706352.1 Alpha/Beta hydrolase protein [Lasiosphaeria miniovina]
MIDHVLGRPSVKSRRLQVLAVIGFWSAYLLRGNKHGPPVFRLFSRMFSKRLTAWQTVVMTMIYLYAARNFSTLVGLASPEPMSNMYDATYFRATWVLTALDAGFWTAMKIKSKWLRDLASIVFSVFYMVAAEKADEKVRKVRGNLTIDHLRISWNKGNQSPYLRFFQGLVRPRFTRWPPRAIRIPRPATSDYKDPVSAWLYYDGPLSDLEHHNKVVLDIPGGGYVAMDPRCNDDKLLAWAAKTGLPVLSLDYKKAPEYPYPYALNECYDVYCTLIKSRGRCIGLSGREVPKVVITGDSAGGTLATSMTLMIIESGSSPVRRFHNGQLDLPIPDGLILFYPAMDMNIGNWMSDEQMALIKDRSMRGTNKPIMQRKSMQYNDLVGTPHQSDNEDDAGSGSKTSDSSSQEEGENTQNKDASDGGHVQDPAPKYAHSGPTTWGQTQQQEQGQGNSLVPSSPDVPVKRQQKKSMSSHHPEPMRTRLAMSSMLSYFNDRVLTPEMMRAMIILYVGPHNRPDFSRDYLLSPILAPDVLLARFPKTYFLTGERDPLVDDTVIFSGRLRRVKAAQIASGGTRFEYQDHDAHAPGFNERDVAEVALIPGISHGFLQFPTVYPPAWGLFDRTAHWIEDVFVDAERKERDRKRGRRPTNDVASNNGLLSGKTLVETPADIASAPATGAATTAGRHHFRHESSGDEDRPLEMMSMTRARTRSVKEAADEASPPVASTAGRGGAAASADSVAKGEYVSEESVPAGTDDVVAGEEDDSGDEATKRGGNNGAAGRGGGDLKRKSKRGGVRRVRTKDHSLIKLASSDDLLSRRMHGLAGGLTGLPTDPE